MEDLFSVEKVLEEVGQEIGQELSPDERREMEEAILYSLTTGLPPLRTLGLSPEMIDVLYGVGHQLYKAEKYEEATKIFRVMSRLDPTNFRAYFGQGLCAHKQKKYSIAMLYYLTSLNYEQEDPLPLYHLAHCFYELEKKEAAIEALEMALERVERHPKQYGAIGERINLWLNTLEPRRTLALQKSEE